MTSNQLKFNLDALVDKINLVNFVHQPQPIVVEKLHSNQTNYGRNSNPSQIKKTNNSFELIDEDKLSMYSYLIQRDLKNKQWLSKFSDQIPERDENNKPTKQAEDAKKTAVKTNSDGKPLARKQEQKAALIGESSSRPGKPILLNKDKNSDNEIDELKKCCDDTMQAVKELQDNLIEFKNERLKVIYNDQSEEEKQERILIEQIKYLSRQMYTFKNQMEKFKKSFQLNGPDSAQHSDSKKKSSKNLTQTTRLILNVRQLVKSVNTFSDLYPYRPERSPICERLCSHFFKQFQASITYLNECLSSISFDRFNHVAARFNNMLADCDKYFDEPLVSNREKSPSEIRASLLSDSSLDSKKVNQKFTKSSSSSALRTIRVNVESTKKFSVANMQAKRETSPPKAKNNVAGLKKKPLKTVRLFPGKPSKSNKKPSTIRPQQRLFEKKSTLTPPIHNNMPNPTFFFLDENSKGKWHSLEENMNLNSNEMFEKPTESVIHFSHNSPSKLKFKSNSDDKLNRLNRFKSNSNRKRACSNLSLKKNNLSDQSLNDATSICSDSNLNYSQNDETLVDDLRLLKRKYDSEKIHPLKSRQSMNELSEDIWNKMENVNLKIPKTVDRIVERLDILKSENDSIRRKYEQLSYQQSLKDNVLVDNKPRRPYEECYLEKEHIVTEEYEAKIDFDKVYKPLNHPSANQLERVMTYSRQFYDYIQKTSVTTIGESKFDDFELFEFLSDDLFDDCYISICEELNDINEELASHLINAEFDVSTQTDLNPNTGQNKLEQRVQLQQKHSSALSRQTSNISTVNQNTSYSSFKTNDVEEEDNEEVESSSVSYSI